MCKKSILLFVFVFSSIFQLEAQTSSHQRDYQKGKEFFNEGNYSLAAQVFRGLMNSGDEHRFEAYATFYYAVSAYQQGEYPLAKASFRQLLRRFPSWHDRDEARLWLTRLYFQEGDLLLAFQEKNKIENGELREKANELAKFHMLEIKEIPRLERLLNEFPYEEIIARQLANQINLLPLTQQDEALLDFIVEEFNFDKSQYKILDIRSSQKKDRYRVAVILPFMHKNIQKGRIGGNQFVVDFYRGLQLGQEYLKSEGINIELYAYDTENDAKVTKEILKKEEIKGMDLIIGPLYPEPFRLVAEFARQHQINFVNPYSTNTEIIDGSPFAHLLKASQSTQAGVVARYAGEALNMRNALIIRGTEKSDSLAAAIYKNELTALGGRVVKEVVFRKDKIKDFNEFISEGIDEDFVIDEGDTLDHIFVATTREIVAAGVVSAMEIRRENRLPLFGNFNWTDFNTVSIDQLSRMETYLSCETYVDNLRPAAERLLESLEVLNDDVALGHDAIVVFAELMKNGGNLFQKYTNEVPKIVKLETVFQGYDFRRSQDNAFVPIIKFHDTEFPVVNDYMLD
ncbi:MAG: tetratricopeptide repeat protein [Cyclobacteriaceae bacterium]|nr:tetratricopeptide repeat protein [Cyclobacteriaceae bacterium]MCH8517051.1 tetratricopeptide repeat protein [Cyclobacteriaceae bacterium]